MATEIYSGQAEIRATRLSPDRLDAVAEALAAHPARADRLAGIVRLPNEDQPRIVRSGGAAAIADQGAHASHQAAEGERKDGNPEVARYEEDLLQRISQTIRRQGASRRRLGRLGVSRTRSDR